VIYSGNTNNEGRYFNYTKAITMIKRIRISHTDLLSLLALVVSIISIYLSAFYKDFSLKVSIVNGEIFEENTELNFLYHNRGNMYATIVQDYIVFYQDEDWRNGVIFKDGKVTSPDFNSIVLKPGEQFLRTLNVKTNFTLDQANLKLDFDKRIKVGLVVANINEEDLRSENLIQVGYIDLEFYSVWVGFPVQVSLKGSHIDFGVFDLDEGVTIISSEVREIPNDSIRLPNPRWLYDTGKTTPTRDSL
jgi:hypothetical protein